MCTIERIISPKHFKALSITNYSRYYDVLNEPGTLDIVASVFSVDEDGSIYASIIAENSDCPIPQNGKGCHIQTFEYPQGTPFFILKDLFNDFLVGAMYRTDDTKGGVIYRYQYIWFEKPIIDDSIITKCFGDGLTEHIIDSNTICVYSILRK